MHQLFSRPNDQELFIMADLGLTCGGNIQRAVELIKTAAQLGVDAVKFQMLDSNELLGDKSVEYTYPTLSKGNITENMYEMFLKLEFTDQEWASIKEECQAQKIGLVVTCHVESAVERVNKLNLPVNKICTWSLSHYRMISSLAQNGKPLIIDTGTIDTSDLLDLSEFYRNAGGGEIFILYDFHTSDPAEMNFSAIRSLVDAGYKVGYTPQGRKDWLDHMAIGLGATFVEKRLTLSREIPENGHWKAHDPSDFKTWIRNIKECYTALGDSQLYPTTQDIMDSKKYYKSAWLNQSVRRGDIIRDDHFDFRRPGTGISSKAIYSSYIGKVFNKNYDCGEMFEG